MNQAIKDRVNAVLESGYLTEGPVTKEFENKFKEYIGCKYALAVTSATTGLEMALRALNIGPGDEVIVPDYTYPATAAVVPIVGAKAIIVDVNKDSMLIDYEEIEKAITPRTKAIIPVSGFGNPLDYEILNRIKEKHHLFIIEDAACAIGAEFNNVKVGAHADIAVFSLHPRKFITTGEGGMVTTNNSKWAEWMNSYKHFGMDISNTNREGIQFKIIGTNYKLSNVQSAIGLGQFEYIHELLGKRRQLAANYDQMLSGLKGITIPKTTKNGIHSYQSYCIHIENRNEVMLKMREVGIEVQIGTYSLHMHEAYRPSTQIELKGNMPNSKWVFDHTLTLPLYHDLTSEQQERVVKQLSLLTK